MAERERSGFSFWASITIFSLVTAFVLTFTTSNYARLTSAKEAEKIEKELSLDTLLTINKLAKEWYMPTVEKLSIPRNLSAEMAEKASLELFGFRSETLWRWLERRADAILDLWYWFLRRVALFVIWIPLWIPMVVMASLHGYWDREIKKTDFGYTSPVLNHWARSTMHLSILITMLMFVVPVAIDPFLFPLFLAIVTVSAAIALGNVQKVL